MLDLAILYILVLCSFFFSFLFETDQERSWAGIVAAFSWFLVGMVYLYEAATSLVDLITVTLFFEGIFIIYVIRLTVSLLQVRHARKHLLDDDIEV